MPFGTWAQVGLSNHVSDGDLDPPGKRQFFWGGANMTGPRLICKGAGIFGATMRPFVKLLGTQCTVSHKRRLTTRTTAKRFRSENDATSISVTNASPNVAE